MVATALGSAPAPAAAQEPIKIGVIYGLGAVPPPTPSPPSPPRDGRRGGSTAREAARRKLQLVVRDDQSKPDVGVREARDLILKEKGSTPHPASSTAGSPWPSPRCQGIQDHAPRPIAKTAALTETRDTATPSARRPTRSSRGAPRHPHGLSSRSSGSPSPARLRVRATGWAKDFVAHLKKLRPTRRSWSRHGRSSASAIFRSPLHALLQAKPTFFSSIAVRPHRLRQAGQAVRLLRQDAVPGIGQGYLDVARSPRRRSAQGMWVSRTTRSNHPDSGRPTRDFRGAKVQGAHGDPPAVGGRLAIPRPTSSPEGHPGSQDPRTQRRWCGALEGLTVEDGPRPLDHRERRPSNRTRASISAGSRRCRSTPS